MSTARRRWPISRRRFAAAGRDAEAAGAWQTALIDGSDMPQIYEWLAETLVRDRDFTAARSILEEAVGRWPSDTRFERTLALSYATLGRGREAIRVLDRYIADGRPSPSCCPVVEWIFQVHNNRAVVINRTADLAMARNYAAEYVKADGPKQALVQQWMDFLANEKSLIRAGWGRSGGRPDLLARLCPYESDSRARAAGAAPVSSPPPSSPLRRGRRVCSAASRRARGPPLRRAPVPSSSAVGSHGRHRLVVDHVRCQFRARLADSAAGGVHSCDSNARSPSCCRSGNGSPCACTLRWRRSGSR